MASEHSRDMARLWPQHERYAGVLAGCGDERIALSMDGRRFWLQKRVGRGWRRIASSGRRDLLASRLGPQWAEVELSALPQFPARVAAPWRGAIGAACAAVKATNPGRDDYSGVIWRSGAVRLVWLRDGRYALQSRGAATRRSDGWRTTRWCKNLSAWDADRRAGEAAFEGVPVHVWSGLPESAASYRGAPVADRKALGRVDCAT